jgi:vacuolar-type H+-ATPase subunit C/Vma6
MKTDYATDIGQLPTQEQDAATLEQLFLKKLVGRTFFIHRAAQGKMQDLLGRYSARFEVENIKRILRAKHGLSSEEPSLIPLPREYTLVNFPALTKAADVEEVASLLRDTPYHTLAAAVQPYRETGTTTTLEAELDKIYFLRIWALVRRFREMRELVGEEVDLRNLLTVLALKAREAPPRLIEDALVPIMYRLPKSTLHSVAESRFEDAASILPMPYSKIASEASKSLKGESAFSVEWFLFNQLYGDARRFSQSHSLQAGYIIAYLLLCECEAKDLISLVTGKQLSLTPEEIAARLFETSQP